MPIALPQDMFYAVNGFIFEGAGMAGNVAVAKPWSGDGFASDDVRLVELLMPHLQRALEIQRRLGAAPAVVPLADWMNDLPYAVLSGRARGAAPPRRPSRDAPAAAAHRAGARAAGRGATQPPGRGRAVLQAVVRRRDGRGWHRS